MRRAVCPHCGGNVYSADNTGDEWKCPYCGRKFEPKYEDQLEDDEKNRRQ